MDPSLKSFLIVIVFYIIMILVHVLGYIRGYKARNREEEENNSLD